MAGDRYWKEAEKILRCSSFASKDPKVVMMCAIRLRITIVTRKVVKEDDFDEILEFEDRQELQLAGVLG